MKLVQPDGRPAAQGDNLFLHIGKKLPAGVVETKREGGRLIVGHSETGHHHAISDTGVKMYSDPKDPLVCYLQLGDNLGEAGGVDVVHMRPWDTHETVRLLGKKGDVWKVRRQREWSPEGWTRVQD